MEFILFLLLCFFCNMVTIIAAFGGTMLAMPFAILLFGAMDARLILNGVSMIACAYPIYRCRHCIDLRQVAKILLFMLLGAALAMVSGPALYSDTVLLLYSIMILSVSIFRLFPMRPLQLPRWTDSLILLLAGIIHGAFLSGGSLLAIYSMKNFREKDTMRGTISVIWLIMNGFVLTGSIMDGAYTPEITKMVFAGMVPAAAGILLGDWLQSKLDQEKFRKFVNGMLLLSGIVLLYNCISR